MNNFSKVHFKIKQLFRAYILKSRDDIEAIRWLKDNKKADIRLKYPFKDNWVVFDCGGYLGDFCQDVLDKNENLDIYVFEPVQKYCNSIRERFQHHKNVKVFDFGLGSKNKSIDIDLNDLHSSEFTASDKRKLISCEIVNVLNFLEQKNIKHIDLIKLNIEGGEYDLLEKLISSGFIRNIKNLQIQFHNYGQWSIDARARMREQLAKTHKSTWSYGWIFENWQLR